MRAILLVALLLDPAVAHAEPHPNRWKMPVGVGLILGLPSPYGYVGGEVVSDPMPWLALAIGVGHHDTGWQYGGMARLRKVDEYDGLDYGYGIGLGYSRGDFQVEHPDPLIRWYRHWDAASWGNVDGFFEMRPEGFVPMRLSLGFSFLLDPNGYRCDNIDPPEIGDPMAELAACKSADLPTGSPKLYFEIEAFL